MVEVRSVIGELLAEVRKDHGIHKQIWRTAFTFPSLPYVVGKVNTVRQITKC